MQQMKTNDKWQIFFNIAERVRYNESVGLGGRRKLTAANQAAYNPFDPTIDHTNVECIQALRLRKVTSGSLTD
jgi:hypothetical protein